MSTEQYISVWKWANGDYQTYICTDIDTYRSDVEGRTSLGIEFITMFATNDTRLFGIINNHINISNKEHTEVTKEGLQELLNSNNIEWHYKFVRS